MDYENNKRLTNKITVYGIVQGVGFRPLVYHIAKNHNLKGFVRNVGGLVEIHAQGSAQDVLLFLGSLKNQQGNGEIIAIDTEEIWEEEFDEFVITASSESDEMAIIPPDLPVCPDCERELTTVTDRRYLNPFLSCMSCGPRYTIMEELPYDRHNTSMKDFSMCPSCNTEYSSAENRRFHAQTISCYDCGPYLIYRPSTAAQQYSGQGQPTPDSKINNQIRKPAQALLTEQEALEAAVRTINSGGILAVKGIGGYHFVSTPFLEETVMNLRKLKGREEKPFAVMFPDLASIQKHCFVTKEEMDLLLSKARPIVLLYLKLEDSMAPSTNKSSMYCGAFLPYTPLQLLLTKQCGPLIMTSANISNKPIIREDEEMLSLRSPYLNGVLYNTRRIVRSVDDSVAKVINHKPQLIRRSRGYVPYPVFLQGDKETEDLQIFAAGGDLKAAYCLYRKGHAVISQYFGDLEEPSLMEAYRNSITDLSGLLKIKPKLAVCDLHPNYYSTHYAKNLGIPVLEVQHHHAHIASVIAEHDLKGKVIGVAFDGTGYGTDGNIWGGEFLVCDGAEYIRAAHLSYNTMLGGDASMRDARKAATCYLLNNGLKDFIEDDRMQLIEAALLHRVNTVTTSSMGRLFDAIASILELQQENSYEGECAAVLEKAAVHAIRTMEKVPELTFAISKKDEIIEIDPKALLQAICKAKDKVNVKALALGFHYALADMILQICECLKENYNSNTVALSGGVFQNTVLTERTMELLRNYGFQVYVNVAVPPNDGCISLGQTYIGLKTSLKN